MHYYSLIPLGAFSLTLFLFSQVCANRERGAAGRAYLYFAACAMAWQLSDGIGWQVSNDAAAYVLRRINLLFWMPSVVLYLNFVHRYTGRRHDSFFYASLVAVVSFTATGLATPLIAAGIRRCSWGVTIVPGPLFLPAVAMVIILPGVRSVILIVREYCRTEDPLLRAQLGLLLWGLALSLSLSIVVNFVLIGLFELNSIPSLGSSLMAVQSLFVVVAMVRYRLFSVSIAQAACELFSMMHDGVIVFDRSQRPVAVNRHAATFFGLTQDAVRARRASELFPSPYCFDKEYHGWECAAGQPGARRVGSLTQVPLMQGPRLVGTLGVLHDVTQERAASRALAESEQRFRDVSLSVGDLIWETDGEHRYTYVSGKVQELLECSPDMLLGKTPFAFMESDAEAAARPWFMRHAEQRAGFEGYVNWNRTAGGRRVCFLTSAVPVFDARGEWCGFRGVSKDSTLQQEVRAQRERLENQVRQSEASRMQSIGQLAGGIAHDFNNMLGGITAFADVLLKKFGNEQPGIERYAARIAETSQQASQLIGTLLTFARRGACDRVPMQVHEALHDALRLLEHSIGPGVHLEVKLSAQRSVIVGNPVQIQGVIINLALNARDAMPQGGVLRIATAAVSLVNPPPGARGEGFRPGAYLRITVSDTGVGMDEHTFEYQFEPFFTTKKADEGTGLGLASVLGTVLGHSGYIDVASFKGTGTTYTIFLPLVASAVVHATAQDSAEPVSGEGGILLIDDEVLANESCAEMIRELGYTVYPFFSAYSAVAFFRESKASIVAVVLDMIMPSMDGYECFRELKKADPEVRVLIATGYANDERIRKTLDAGACGILSKPFRMRNLALALARITQNRDHGR